MTNAVDAPRETMPNAEKKTLLEALKEVGAMDEDGEGITISNISPLRAAVLIPKLVKAMLMFKITDREFDQVGKILQFVATTPGYDAAPVVRWLEALKQDIVSARGS